jgi:diguanylate cyclase (GGDEF)-like protein
MSKKKETWWGTIYRWLVFDGATTKDDSVLVRKIWSIFFFFILLFTYVTGNTVFSGRKFVILVGVFVLINIVNSVVRYKIKDQNRVEFHYLQYLDVVAALLILVFTGWQIQISFIFYLSIVLAILTYGTTRGYIFTAVTTVCYGLAYLLFTPAKLDLSTLGYLGFALMSMVLTAYNGGVLKGQIKEVEKANQELDKRNSELFVLQQVSSHVSSVLNIDDLLVLIPDILVGISGAEFASIYLSEKGTYGTLKIKATNCPDEKKVHELFMGVCSYQVRNAFLAGKTTIENHIHCGEFGSMMNIPIKHKDELLGMLVLTHYNPDSFTEANLQLLVPVVNQLAIAIANARLYNKVKQMANIDGLTGIYNRKYMQDYLAEFFSKPVTGQITLVMIDVDLFKRVNDTFGHLMGDRVLKMVTDVVNQLIGDRGFIARYGGEEFVVVFPEIGMDEGYEIAEELRKLVSVESIYYLDEVCQITISLGVAGNELPNIHTMDELLHAADGALYEAKEHGRNCTIRADELILQKKC